MDIRVATDEDVPAIVGLLRQSLGEGLMPKSESFWRWKHVQNPFGPSPVLLATEGDDIIGVRAFMRWEWHYRSAVVRAVRAVDTATHPSHQGKGIFTKLSLALVAGCKEEGTHFIFNTPNKISRPGYLKMGWKDVGRLPMYISPYFVHKPKAVDLEEKYSLELFLNSPHLQPLLDDHQSTMTSMHTRYSGAYLRWRYLSNPNIRYLAAGNFSGSSSFLFICRSKPGRYVHELRVGDAFVASKADKKDMRIFLQELIQDTGTGVLSFAGGRNALPVFSLRAPVGPRVTAMDLNFSRELGSSVDFRNWSPSLGDMEVF